MYKNFTVLVFLLVISFQEIGCKTVIIAGDSHSTKSFMNVDIEKRSGDNYLLEDSWVFDQSGKQVLVPYKIIYLGPITMNRVGRESVFFFNEARRDKLDACEGDVVVFCFGEIDIRSHVLRQVDRQHRSVDYVLNNLVKRYIKVLLDFKSFYEDVEVVLFNVVPPSDHDHGHRRYNQYGLLSDRVIAAKKLNQKLKERALENGLKFLDVYDIYAAEDGSLNMELSDYTCHIHEEKNEPVKKELCKLLGIID